MSLLPTPPGPDPAARSASGAPPPLPVARPTPARRWRLLLWRSRALVAALCLGATAAAVVHAVRPPPPATVPVVVLTRDVPAGTTLTPDDVTVARVAPGAAPQRVVTTVPDAVGGVTAVALPASMPLAPALLVDAALTGPPGTVVTAVRLDDPAVAALLAPGLRVDLVAARPEGGHGRTVARRALVLPAPADGPAGAGGGLLGGVAAPDEAPPVVVALTPDEALAVAESSASSRLVAVVVP
ncbi:SAF domain-containing protein [Cellulomonas iranensis]|uniref:SAF domain-containing protein n=1 Tax=Cellulomonas iranensis TaxID=76862 RepID=UPI003D7E8FF2